ncbi:hypothetical protein DPEC_G00316710 [Dallia pectoralis]|uniref:Uncharacterized protein n=1 Tax=Dallia pectoralis TaxID=75939 RepID=A0ACC2FCL4_DALPE|nr:hypothetical protein DPEC_G00316710 [Dallia pectoralis]
MPLTSAPGAAVALPRSRARLTGYSHPAVAPGACESEPRHQRAAWGATIRSSDRINGNSRESLRFRLQSFSEAVEVREETGVAVDQGGPVKR